MELGKREDGSVPELEFEQLPSSHPLFIMYSSGTTGVPKCMVHSAGVSALPPLSGVGDRLKADGRDGVRQTFPEKEKKKKEVIY